jgi:hypothetical protein
MRANEPPCALCLLHATLYAAMICILCICKCSTVLFAGVPWSSLEFLNERSCVGELHVGRSVAQQATHDMGSKQYLNYVHCAIWPLHPTDQSHHGLQISTTASITKHETFTSVIHLLHVQASFQL